MPKTIPLGAADFRRRSGEIRDWCSVVTPLLLAGILIRHLVLPLVDIAQDEDAVPLEVLDLLARHAAMAGPAIFYACALWALRNTFGRLAEGATFQPAVIGGLVEVGRNLLWGAGTAMLVTPNILAWTDDRPGGFDIEPDIALVVIGALGVTLGVLARLLTQAAEQEAELGEII